MSRTYGFGAGAGEGAFVLNESLWGFGVGNGVGRGVGRGVGTGVGEGVGRGVGRGVGEAVAFGLTLTHSSVSSSAARRIAACADSTGE